MNWLSCLMRHLPGLSLGLMLPVVVAAQSGPQACGNPFRNHFGPFDYRTAPAETRKLVEDYHFTQGIQTMTRPQNTMMHNMAVDVGYTLNVFPNHPRALLLMYRLSVRWKSDPPPGSGHTVECWFDRAIRFRPDDTVVRALYAQFLGRKNRRDDAMRQLSIAVEQAKDNPMSHYNIGLVAMEMGYTELALQQAHRALAMGFTRPELAEQLRSANAWVDPAAPGVAAAASEAQGGAGVSAPRP